MQTTGLNSVQVTEMCRHTGFHSYGDIRQIHLSSMNGSKTLRSAGADGRDAVCATQVLLKEQVIRSPRYLVC